MKHFVIYTNQNKDPDLMVTKRIRSYLEGRGQSVSTLLKEYGRRGEQKEDAADRLSHADCMIVLGGDGTVLQAAGELGSCHVPIIGVNLGTLGYMTEIEPDRLEEALERLIKGDYEQESRMMLRGGIFAGAQAAQEGCALNDIVISRSGALQIIRFIVCVNGQFINEYHADGMIVSTPTGSTGYNLSAGGPVIEPRARLILLTPICPHSFNRRSIVLSPDDVIEIEIPESKEGRGQTVYANFDGGRQVEMHTGDRIRISQSEENAEFIQLNRVSFLEVLHKKMNES